MRPCVGDSPSANDFRARVLRLFNRQYSKFGKLASRFEGLEPWIPRCPVPIPVLRFSSADRECATNYYLHMIS
jgi:hypothetical protein